MAYQKLALNFTLIDQIVYEKNYKLIHITQVVAHLTSFNT